MFYFVIPAVFLTLRKFCIVILITRSGSIRNVSNKEKKLRWQIHEILCSKMSQGKVMKYDRCHLPMYVSAAVNKKLPSFNPILIN